MLPLLPCTNTSRADLHRDGWNAGGPFARRLLPTGEQRGSALAHGMAIGRVGFHGRASHQRIDAAEMGAL